MVPEIRTDRLLMRGWRETDKPAYAGLNADPLVMRHFPSTLTADQSGEMVDRIMARWAHDGLGLWAVERLDNGRFIGFVGLTAPGWHLDGVTPCVEIGWRLAAEHWGQGYAPEAAREALRFAFDHVDLPGDEVVSFTTTQNVASQRVMGKIGMRHDPARDFDHPMTPGWAGQRHVLYRISRDEWQAARAASVAR
jgi:RimJ/RimL family protein N-acetyltransferase